MSDTAKDQRVKSALVVDAQSLWTVHTQRRIDYAAVLAYLSESMDILYAGIHSNYFDPAFAEHLQNLGFQVFGRQYGHVFDLVNGTVTLCTHYKTVIVLTESDYIPYLKQEAARKGTYLFHMGLHGDITLPDTLFRKRQP